VNGASPFTGEKGAPQSTDRPLADSTRKEQKMLSDYLSLFDVKEFTLVMALIAAFYSIAGTNLAALIRAIFWGKPDEIQSLLAKKKPASSVDVLDVLPADESAVLEPVQTQTI
jgi:hypothetical protein